MRRWLPTRILVINSGVPMATVERASGEEWSHLNAVRYGHNLYVPASPDVVDYDVFIVDPDNIELITKEELPHNRQNIDKLIVERVAGGGCLICFAGLQPVAWLPVQFSNRGAISGHRIRIEAGHDPLTPLLEKYEAEISYRTQFAQPEGWNALARALNSYPIAGYATYGSGLILMLPEFKNRAAVIREILDMVIPKMLPDVEEAAVSLAQEPPPWLTEFPISKSDALAQEMAGLDSEIHRLRDERETKDRERRDLLEYQGLLWLEGKPLEAVVQKALNLLGISVEPKPPVDLACPAPTGAPLPVPHSGWAHSVHDCAGRSRTRSARGRGLVPVGYAGSHRCPWRTPSSTRRCGRRQGRFRGRRPR